MSGFDSDRRAALKHIALLGAAGLVPEFLTSGSAGAAGLTAGFVYIGPRLDWGWNQSHALAAAALRGEPKVRTIEPGNLPQTTDYCSGK
jgi:simple sugar transport system substrate-binding protein